MEMLSDRYGWTPEQIRAQPYEDILAYLEIISAKNRLEKARAKQNKYAHK